MHIQVPRVTPTTIAANTNIEESSAKIQKRVKAAAELQIRRSGKTNSLLKGKELDKFCPMNKAAESVLLKAADHLGLSARAMHRIMRVARTIADMDNSEKIANSHVSEALGYRSM